VLDVCEGKRLEVQYVRHPEQAIEADAERLGSELVVKIAKYSIAAPTPLLVWRLPCCAFPWGQFALQVHANCPAYGNWIAVN
jgi:hypothetical protein